jgi:hypothetical protein
MKIFKNEAALEISLERDASADEWGRLTCEFAYKEARRLAHEHFKVIKTNEAYKRLLHHYEERIGDYDFEISLEFDNE